MFDDEVEVTETKLPGIGMRYDFLTDAGRRIGVVSHRDGDRDLLVFSKDDPDSCSSVLQMSASRPTPWPRCWAAAGSLPGWPR